MAVFTGDRSKIKQVDPGKFLDQASGNYYTGTFDNATNWGSDYSKVGVGTPPPTTTAPTGPAPPTAPPTTTADPYKNLPGLTSPTLPTLPSNPYAPTTPARDNATTTTGNASPAGFGNASFDQISRYFRDASGGKYEPTQQDVSQWGTNIDQPYMAKIGQQIGSWWNQQQTAPVTPPTQTSDTSGGDWIAQALQQAQSTDDPAYWRGVIAKDPKVAAGDPSAIQYWKERIAIGDGALAVRNGTARKFQDGPSVQQQGPQTLPGYQPLAATQTGTAQDAVGYLNQLSKSLGGADLTPEELAKYAAMVGYKEGQPVTGAMVNQIASAMMQAKGLQPPGQATPTTSPTVPPPGGTYTSTNPFDDPATKNYIDLLNTRIQELLKPRQDPSLDAFMQMIQQRTNGLNTPYTNPDAAPLQDWMRKYFAQLQGPTYTPQQQDTIQTQALDPLERQRQARKQQVVRTMGSHGMSPTDGPTLGALAEVDRQFDTIRAQTQSGLAVNEINQGRSNQAQAANVGGSLANYTQGQFANNENRANEAVSLFGTIPQLNLSEFQNQEARANQAVTLGKQIPDMAQSRLTTAINLLNGSNVNPASLLQPLQGFQQQGMNQNTQDSQFWSQLIAQIAKQFGL